MFYGVSGNLRSSVAVVDKDDVAVFGKCNVSLSQCSVAFLSRLLFLSK